MESWHDRASIRRIFRARARCLVEEARATHDTEWAAITSVAQKLGVSTETLRKWVRQAEVDSGQRSGTTSDESAELRRLRREHAELKRANEILKAASAFFAAELDRPVPR
ncbi:transposase [Actinoplanes sp. CA-030573]